MTERNNSQDEWQKAIIERQHNLTPADITRTSQFRASGLSKSAPLPIAIRRSYICGGAALVAVGIALRVASHKPLLVAVGTTLGAIGLFVMLSAIRWAAKSGDD